MSDYIHPIRAEDVRSADSSVLWTIAANKGFTKEKTRGFRVKSRRKDEEEDAAGGEK